jgi:hypothetical protein
MGTSDHAPVIAVFEFEGQPMMPKQAVEVQQS